MEKIHQDYKTNFLFLIIAFFCLAATIGIDNLSFSSVGWLHDGNESAIEQTAWYFFRNDVWRFPFGNNPNYGDEISTSIVFSDSIPFLAIFFKIFKSILPQDFQYFSLWYFICFYFQLFFSFKILKKFTNSQYYSLIGSIFFLLAPIFIFRLNWHASVSAQWLLLFTLYLSLTRKVDESKFLWFFLIILSSLILYNFTIIIVTAYSIIRLIELDFNKKGFFRLAKDFFIIITLLLLTMYFAGYFQIRMMDTLALGFGHYKLNILSIIDPINSASKISWSWFLPDIQLSKEEELEGFNYLGLGQILMVIFSFFIFFINKNKTYLESFKKNKQIKIFIIISIFFTIWALSNKISFGSYELIEIPLNKFFLGILSVSKSTGRLFWIVNYFIIIISLIIIYKCFKKKHSLIIITLFLLIQIIDISPGLKDRINYFSENNKQVSVKDPIWSKLFKKYKILKTTYPSSFPGIFYNFSFLMENKKIKKTNLAPQSRMNRKVGAETRYSLYKNFNNKILEQDTVYIIAGLSHLRNLKSLFKNQDVAFFYRDNIWFMVNNEKSLMNSNDNKMFNAVESKLLTVDKEEVLNFKDPNSYYGLGWSHNRGKPGIWSEGPSSTILFKTKDTNKNLILSILASPYINKKNKFLEFDIYINNVLNKNLNLKNKEEKEIEILINKDLITNNEVKVDFKFKNSSSPSEVLESPDSRKIGILIKSIKITKI